MEETRDIRADEQAEHLADTAGELTLDAQRRLVLRLAPRVYAGLPEDEREAFLQELQENLVLGAATIDRPVAGNSNPGALEVPTEH